MAAKLILTFNDQVIGEQPLNKETITIGRHPDNDIRIDNLAVSGHHAKILTILNDSFIEDLGSTNGTFVNQKLIKKHALRNGEVIGVGKHGLRYVNEEASEESDFERTMIIRPDALGMQGEDTEDLSEDSQNRSDTELMEAAEAAEASQVAEAVKVAQAEPEEKVAKLQILNGNNAGKEMVLTKALTTLGKPGIQVAAITKRPQGCFLIHVDGGPNDKRPLVNDQQVGPKAHLLEPNDVIEVAGVKLEFFFG